MVPLPPPRIVHPPKNMLEPSGGLVMNTADVPPPVTRPLAVAGADGAAISLPSTEAVEALKAGIRPDVPWKQRSEFYNAALSPASRLP